MTEGEQRTRALEETVEELSRDREGLRSALGVERLHYRDLFEWTPDVYLVTDRDGVILEANRAAERLLGHETGLLLGQSIAAFLPQSEREPFGLMLERMTGLEVVSDWELQLNRPGGGTFTAAVTLGWVGDRSGQGGALGWLIRDVSERRATEEQMVAANIALDRRVTERTTQLERVGREKDEALARLEAILDQIPAAIVIADAASGKIVAANEHASRLVWNVVGSAEALDHWLSIGFHPDGRRYGIGERPIMRALATGESVEPEPIEFHLLDGARALYETSAAPIRSVEGDVVAAVAAYWDLTERERLGRAEREFVTNAAHELRTPLAALASAVDVLQAGAKDDPEHRDRFLAHVEQQSERLQRLVRSLLLLARLQTGQGTTEAEPVSVRDLLESVAVLGESERIRVEADLPGETQVLANRDLAEQALLNLLSNATKYAPEGEIVLRGQTRGGYVALEVVDRGPGMTDEETELAPLRFFRGRDDNEGFGLGLAIAKQAVEALGGRLELETDGARGTTARLLLPLAAAHG